MKVAFKFKEFIITFVVCVAIVLLHYYIVPHVLPVRINALQVGIAILYSIALIFIHKSSRKKENRLGLVLFMIFVPLIQILIISDIGLLLGLFAFGIPFYYSISIIAGIATLLFYRQIVKTHNLFFGIIISAVLLVFVPVISFELTNFELFSVLGGYHSGYWIIWQVMNGLAISIIGSIKSQKGIQKKLKTNL